jgi:hypothetical protein
MGPKDDDGSKHVKIWKNFTVACFKVLPQHSPGEAEENYENLHTEKGREVNSLEY